MIDTDGINILKNIVRIGTVSSLDKENRTARVAFEDRDNLVSGPLKVLKNPPLVEIEEVNLTYGVEEAEGHTHAGRTEAHFHEVTVTPWLPEVGDFVLCIYLPNGESDGFVVGGI